MICVNGKGSEQVQNYIIEILLGFNLIAAIFLLVRSAVQKRESNPQQGLDPVIIENQKKMSREINELKLILEQYHRSVQGEFEQLRAERKAFEKSVITTTKVNNGQDLLLNNRYKEIFDLQKQGLSVEEIAKQLEKGTGEVSFILQLGAKEDV